MKKYTILLLALVYTTLSFAQKVDPRLQQRLDTYMRLSRELRIDELMDYMHPSIFKLATREQLSNVIRQAFDNESMLITIDSTHVTSISPDFMRGLAHYRRIDYQMWMHVEIKDTSIFSKPNAIETITGNMKRAYPDATVTFDRERASFAIYTTSLLMAIKDNAEKPWGFLGYQHDAQLLNQLYPKEVIAHYKLL